MKLTFPFSFHGLLGMNRRNSTIILPGNPRKNYPLVDNKLRTKQLLEDNDLPTPPLYFEIAHEFELRYLREIKFMKEFVVKPARGAEGRGILVITGKEGGDWIKSSGEKIRMADIEHHISNILAGLYSLGGTDDQAFIEYLIHVHPVFEKISYRGVPDIRVILYRGIPIMSMLRLPTKASDGKANLHQGAIGVGVNMLTGTTLGAVHKNKLIEKHPDTSENVRGVKIPFWDQIMTTAAKTFNLFGLGYIGVDFVIDHLMGPLILEVNARPGLSIQLANREGLLPRIQAVDRFGKDVPSFSVEERLKIFREVVAM